MKSIMEYYREEFGLHYNDSSKNQEIAKYLYEILAPIDYDIGRDVK